MYYLLLPDLDARTTFINRLKQRGIQAVFHYVPLHSSPMGERYCRASGELTHTSAISDRLVRLPLWLGLEDSLPEVVKEIVSTLDSLGSANAP
jgi:dTDP-4-amino-4,6-dideoxygalactose transaminase